MFNYSYNPLDELEKNLKELLETSIGRRYFLATLPLLLASCATQEKHRYREGDNTGQVVDMSVADERKLTKEILPNMRKDYPPLKDVEVQNYISFLGNKIVNANNLQGNPYNYNFTAVDVKYVNAFALPAGTIFITAPLISMVESEAELAGVIGHEIGHVIARHSAERMYKIQKEQKKSLWYTLGGGLLGGFVGYKLGETLCPSRDKKCLRNATELGLMAGAGGALLIQKYGFMANSREDEMEADRIGFKTAIKASYSKEHVGKFYSRLLKMEKDTNKNNNAFLKSLADALSTHPPSEERVQQMYQMEKSTPKRKTAVVSSKDFYKIKNKIKKYVKLPS